MRGPWPTTRVSLNATTTPVCDSVSGSPGRCTCQSLTAVGGIEGVHGAVDAEDEDARPGDERRGRDANAEHLLPLDLAAFERDQLAAARDDRGDLAVAADAGRDLGADVGAPERAAALGLDREDAAVARRKRQHIAVDGDGERELDRADALASRPAAR